VPIDIAMIRQPAVYHLGVRRLARHWDGHHIELLTIEVL
jgi:hypothetical protein